MISIIVPVYNAEKYLSECIQSILSQSYQDYEAILVDDGSTDMSGEICEQYAKTDKRVKAFHKQNGGVSSARNLGITEAIGKYITFVDADDYLAPNYLLELVAENDVFDLVVGGATIIDNNNECICKNECNDTIIRSKADFVFFFPELDESVVFDAPWNKLFRTSIIKRNAICFDENFSYGEDKLFVLSYMKHVESIHVIPTCSYYYRDNGNNKYYLSSQYLSRWRDKCLSAWQELYIKWSSDGMWKEPDYITRFRAHYGYLIVKNIICQAKLPLLQKIVLTKKSLQHSKRQGRIPLKLMKTKKQMLYSILCWL